MKKKIEARQAWSAGIAAAAAVALLLGVSAGPSRTVRAAGAKSVQQTGQDWPAYGGQPDQDHYSSLAQINRGNVSKLKVAWSFDTGETGSIESTPRRLAVIQAIAKFSSD